MSASYCARFIIRGLPALSNATTSGVPAELSNRYQESSNRRYSGKKLRIERPNRRRTTTSGTSCPPFNTRSLTLDSATSTLFTHRKKKCTSYPFFLSCEITLKYLRPDKVVSKAKVPRRSAKKLISLNM